MATTSPRLRELVCHDMLRGAIGALAMRSAASPPVQSELLALVRDILFQELLHSPDPEQVGPYLEAWVGSPAAIQGSRRSRSARQIRASNAGP